MPVRKYDIAIQLYGLSDQLPPQSVTTIRAPTVEKIAKRISLEKPPAMEVEFSHKLLILLTLPSLLSLITIMLTLWHICQNVSQFQSVMNMVSWLYELQNVRAGISGTAHTPLTVTTTKALAPLITIFLRVRELKISNRT